jgi:superfamily II DNA or RNA helicase
MPTGSGKTVVAGELARRSASRGKRVLFVVHLKELVLQSVQHFEAIGLRVGILQGDNTDYTESDQVVVASIHTIRSRSAPSWIDLVIIDEVHILYRAHVELMERWNALYFIGLSATPLREDLGKYFSNLVRGPSVRWLTDNGFLVPARAYCPGAEHMTKILEGISCNTTPMGYDFNQTQLGQAMNQKELVGDIVKTWQQLGEDRQTLCFAVNKAHSRSIVEDFELAGVTAAHIEDRTPDAERRDLINRFRRGEIRILSSVGVLGIGFDVPDASCLILARPTKSEALDMQQKGRGIRSAEGKRDCLIFDHAGNCLTHGLPVHFEVPDLQELERQRNERKKREAKMVSCSNCGFALERDQFTCPACGVDRPKPKPKVTYLDGSLVEYGSLADGAEHPSLEQKKEIYRQLLWYAQEHGYKRGWVMHKYRERFKEGWPSKSWNRLQPHPAEPGLLRWIKSQQIRYAKSRDRLR